MFKDLSGLLKVHEEGHQVQHVVIYPVEDIKIRKSNESIPCSEKKILKWSRKQHVAGYIMTAVL